MWDLVKIPEEHRTIGYKWSYEKKKGTPGAGGVRYRACLVGDYS